MEMERVYVFACGIDGFAVAFCECSGPCTCSCSFQLWSSNIPRNCICANDAAFGTHLQYSLI
ncbi:hypothetical protein LguiA_005143 [Lonicera macranthoides]